MVVDDAIVVLENIFRHREELDPTRIGRHQWQQRGGLRRHGRHPVAGVHLSPLAFISGIIGQFFRSQLCPRVTFGVLVSLFVSSPRRPMLCARYLRVEKQHGPIYRAFDHLFAGLDAIYAPAGSAPHPSPVGAAGHLAVVGLQRLLFTHVTRPSPRSRTRDASQVSLRTPLGSSIDYTGAKLREVEAILDQHPEIRSEFALIGLGTPGRSTRARWWCAWSRAGRAQREAAGRDPTLLRKEFSQVAGAGFSPHPIRWSRAAGRATAVRADRRNLQELGRRTVACNASWPPSPASAAWTPTCSLDLPNWPSNPTACASPMPA